jgi:hypothetical protein
MDIFDFGLIWFLLSFAGIPAVWGICFLVNRWTTRPRRVTLREWQIRNFIDRV